MASSSSEPLKLATTSFSFTLFSINVPSATFVTVSVGASSNAVTTGVAEPLTVCSVSDVAVTLTVGKVPPPFTNSAPADVNVTVVPAIW